MELCYLCISGIIPRPSQDCYNSFPRKSTWFKTRLASIQTKWKAAGVRSVINKIMYHYNAHGNLNNKSEQPKGLDSSHTQKNKLRVIWKVPLFKSIFKHLKLSRDRWASRGRDFQNSDTITENAFSLDLTKQGFSCSNVQRSPSPKAVNSQAWPCWIY